MQNARIKYMAIVKMNKRITLYLLIGFVACFSGGFSLAGDSAPQEKAEVVISMDIKDKPLRSVLQDISERTGYHVEVSDDLLDIPISGNFKDTTLTALLGRMLKGRNVFILENDQVKLITVRTSLSKKEKVTTVYMENKSSASAENYSLRDLQKVRISLDRMFNEQSSRIETSPGVSYRKMIETKNQLDQQLSSSSGESEVEASPGVTYQEAINYQKKLNDLINDKNGGVRASSGVIYQEVIQAQGKLDSYVQSGESSLEASPGVSYKKLQMIQAKLDQQLTVR